MSEYDDLVKRLQYEIIQLEVNNSGLKEGARLFAGGIDMRRECADAITQLQARVAELEKDAGRYRWLRSQHEIDDEKASNTNYGKSYPRRTMTVFRDDGEDGLEPIECDPGALDEAIDAARDA